MIKRSELSKALEGQSITTRDDWTGCNPVNIDVSVLSAYQYPLECVQLSTRTTRGRIHTAEKAAGLTGLDVCIAVSGHSPTSNATPHSVRIRHVREFALVLFMISSFP